MRALILADLHFSDWYKWQSFLQIDRSRFDIIFLLGDIDIMLLESIKKNFADVPMLGVHGNHDYPGDLSHFEILDVHGKVATFKETRFLGVEGCVRYKSGEAPIHEQEEITALLQAMPPVDIVLSHNSPRGIHDKPDTAHVGYKGLRSYIDRHAPKYVFHGHQHGNQRTMVGQTEVINIYGGVLFDMESGQLEQILDVDEE